MDEPITKAQLSKIMFWRGLLNYDLLKEDWKNFKIKVLGDDLDVSKLTKIQASNLLHQMDIEFEMRRIEKERLDKEREKYKI